MTWLPVVMNKDVSGRQRRSLIRKKNTTAEVCLDLFFIPLNRELKILEPSGNSGSDLPLSFCLVRMLKKLPVFVF